MEWQIAIALAVVIPVVLIPVAFIWLLNFGGLYSFIKRARERRAALSKVKA